MKSFESCFFFQFSRFSAAKKASDMTNYCQEWFGLDTDLT